MEERARIPVDLPLPNPTTSYWQDPPDEVANLQTTKELPKYADYVIIGSGISGTAIAYNLIKKKPNSSILLLEARQACSGATGRNGNFQIVFDTGLDGILTGLNLRRPYKSSKLSQLP